MRNQIRIFFKDHLSSLFVNKHEVFSSKIPVRSIIVTYKTGRIEIVYLIAQKDKNFSQSM